jgi:hypothetical protein
VCRSFFQQAKIIRNFKLFDLPAISVNYSNNGSLSYRARIGKKAPPAELVASLKMSRLTDEKVIMKAQIKCPDELLKMS